MGKRKINLKPFYCYIIIIVITVLVFYNSLFNGFVFDDEFMIEKNVSIKYLSNIPKFFTAEKGFHQVVGDYYRPISSTSFAIDYAIWNLNPFGYHLTNIIIHIIACLLLFKILSTLFIRHKHKNLFSLLATLIFAVHPIHTEAVTWICGRTDSMTTLFFFASFLCYIQFTKERGEDSKRKNAIHETRAKNYTYLFLSLLFYVLGFLTKEMIVTLPIIILLYDFVYRKKDLEYFKENILAYSLFITITIVFIILRYFLLKNIQRSENYLYFIGKDFNVVLGTMLKTIPVYFRLLFIPFPLIYHYNGVISDANSLIHIEVLLSFLFIVFLILLSVYFYKKDSIISFSILFFFISLLPVMNILPTMSLMAERFLYFTSFALALLICHLTLRLNSKTNYLLLTIGLVIIISSLSYLTFMRNMDWKDNNTLYLSAKGVEGSLLLVHQGNILANAKKYDEAEKLFKRAIEIRDNSILAQHNMGLIYFARLDIDSAEKKFFKVISIDSLFPDAYLQLATLYKFQGKKEQEKNVLEKLQTIYPNYKNSASILGELISTDSTGDNSNSLESGIQDISLREVKAYKLFKEKRYEEAIRALQDLINLVGDTSNTKKSEYLNNIGMCYLEMNQPDLEKKYFLEAINLDSKNLNALIGIAAYYKKTGDVVRYKYNLSQILKLNPNDLVTKKLLDSLNSK